MKRSELIRTVAKRHPRPFRRLLVWRQQRRLPLRLARHWIFPALEEDLWPSDARWVGELVTLPNGVRIEVDPRDAVSRAIIQNGWHEPETVDLIHRVVSPGMVFFDVGAHVGQYSLIASKLVGQDGAVHSFEPHPILFEALRRNLRRNQCHNVCSHNAAADVHPGSSTLFLATASNVGATSLRPPANDSGERSAVQRSALDTYVRSRGIGRVDLVKLDVEGAELDALQGARAVLVENPEICIIYEIFEPTARLFGRSTTDVARYLRTLGFQIFRINAGIRLNPNIAATSETLGFNAVATRRPDRLQALAPIG
jgi:FkbM family methyltransferase